MTEAKTGDECCGEKELHVSCLKVHGRLNNFKKLCRFVANKKKEIYYLSLTQY